jgi:hypothetical protein
LKTILGIVGNLPQIVCSPTKFSSGESGALLLLCAFQFGLDKIPSHDELSEAFGKSGFKPSFGARAKSNLKSSERIEVSAQNMISITPKGLRDVEGEIKRIIGQ